MHFTILFCFFAVETQNSMDNNFNKTDFDNLLFKVHLVDLKNCDIHKQFPDLIYYPEFSKANFEKLPRRFSPAQILAYIAYVYDINSPYVKVYDHLIKRKKQAANAALFDKRVTGEFVPDAEVIISNRNSIVNAMIIRYLRVLKNSKWSSLISYYEALSSSELALISPMTESKERAANLTMNITLRKEIELLEKEFLGKDDGGDIIKELYNAIEDVELSTPEFIALKQFKKENIELFNPYINRIPIAKYMQLVKDGLSTKEFDNPELIPLQDEC